MLPFFTEAVTLFIVELELAFEEHPRLRAAIAEMIAIIVPIVNSCFFILVPP